MSATEDMWGDRRFEKERIIRIARLEIKPELKSLSLNDEKLQSIRGGENRPEITPQ